MKRIGRLPLEMLFAGSRILCELRVQECIKVSRELVATLMKCMGVEAL